MERLKDILFDLVKKGSITYSDMLTIYKSTLKRKQLYMAISSNVTHVLPRMVREGLQGTAKDMEYVRLTACTFITDTHNV